MWQRRVPLTSTQMPGTTEASAPDHESRPRDAGVTDIEEPRVPGGIDLSRWLGARKGGLVENWMHELVARELGGGADVHELVARFARQFVGMLPEMVGAYRNQIQSQWDRLSELYGVVAARRGLAAGEAIDELHVLRELVIRELYRDPPGQCDAPLMLREFLRLNRSLDRAVTHVSVGHTDALFFQFFEGDGVSAPALAADAFGAEAEEQLGEIESDVEGILRQAPWHHEAREH